MNCWCSSGKKERKWWRNWVRALSRKLCSTICWRQLPHKGKLNRCRQKQLVLRSLCCTVFAAECFGHYEVVEKRKGAKENCGETPCCCVWTDVSGLVQTVTFASFKNLFTLVFFRDLEEIETLKEAMVWVKPQNLHRCFLSCWHPLMKLPCLCVLS